MKLSLYTTFCRLPINKVHFLVLFEEDLEVTILGFLVMEMSSWGSRQGVLVYIYIYIGKG